MNNYKYIKIGTVIGLLLPSFVFAAGTLKETINNLIKQFSKVPVLLIGVALIYFLVAIVSYASGADEKTRGEAQKKIGYGLVGLFVMTAMWGLMAAIQSTLGI